ncbi:hypothetical protein [Cohnella rhizosphaerae]|uniref:Uncharacterized protein n=1 Tax=Cohnella rhizosphaerae TaxID=1457232 RepID=A0A9X4QUM2_9BACL|nr:hypothetical protein [Cohnella rhizosphaerae]MDG0812411.1 hypothetical protein [Cohnella rhizosphaerae]
MDMNIGSLMRALMKDGQPTDVKALELRIGQIVRGVLIEMLDGQDALMNINGVPVRARLEADLSVGQSTLLQVRPDSSTGLISLRPLPDAAQADAADETLTRDGVKAFGLPEQPWSRELLRGLARDGYPVTRETADWFAQAAAAKPAAADAQEWMNAAGVAFRRGLQPTETTVGSLRQALYGPPLHEQLSTLEALAGRAAADPSVKTETSEAARRILTLLKAVSTLVEGQAFEEADRASRGGERAGSGGAAAREAEPGVVRRQDGSGGPAGQAGPLRQADARQESVGRGNLLPQTASAAEAEGAAQSAAEPAGRRSPDSAAAAASRSAVGAHEAAGDAAAGGGRAGAAGASAASQRPAGGAVPGEPSALTNADKEPSWIGKLLSALGVSHEHAALKSGAWSEAQSGLSNGGEQGTGEATMRQGDSLKSALLALGASDDAPPALREAAQNLVQQITGQQLLLSAERQNTAMMSHLTLFVPMKGQDGETTAKVHIEARRGAARRAGRGQLQAALRPRHAAYGADRRRCSSRRPIGLASAAERRPRRRGTDRSVERRSRRRAAIGRLPADVVDGRSLSGARLRRGERIRSEPGAWRRLRRQAL